MKIEDFSLIRSGSIEARDYQLKLAESIDGRNCIVVLPTGLGKTAIATLVIAETLQKRGGKALFLAPTRILVQQHRAFLQKVLNIGPDSITAVTGEDDIIRRQDSWQGKVICATPQITVYDYKRGLFDPASFSILVVDEVHRAIGNHSYVEASKIFDETVQKIGLTATLPSDKEKIEQIRNAISAQNILYRDYESEDVRPFIHKVGVEIKQLEPPAAMKSALFLLKEALKSKMSILANEGLISQQAVSRLSFREMIEKRELILNKGSWNARFAYTVAAKLFSLIKYLETQTYASFLDYYERIRSEQKRASQIIARDEGISRAVQLIREEMNQGKEHPKLAELKKIISELSPQDRALVFTGYRDTVELLTQKLNSYGYRAWMLIGKQGEGGQTQEEQLKAVEEFRKGNYQVLVATQIGEEGLDIAECNTVVFYDNVPSAIRYIQRRGRTGRRAEGKMIMLMVKGTSDEAYYWVVQRRLKAMRKYISSLEPKASGREKKADASGTLDKFL